ncbi:MAG: hypothetical protein O3C21_10165 [Verrucomicrobia bacterium]|nr:hypothetical protein [Verrucomicrobiota bacterium]
MHIAQQRVVDSGWAHLLLRDLQEAIQHHCDGGDGTEQQNVHHPPALIIHLKQRGGFCDTDNGLGSGSDRFILSRRCQKGGQPCCAPPEDSLHREFTGKAQLILYFVHRQQTMPVETREGKLKKTRSIQPLNPAFLAEEKEHPGADG